MDSGGLSIPIWNLQHTKPFKVAFGSGVHTSTNRDLYIDGVLHQNDNTAIMSVWKGSDGVDDNGVLVWMEIGLITHSNSSALIGRIVKRYRHGATSSGNLGQNWQTVPAIYSSTFTATTDDNGFLTVPNNIVRPNTGCIMSAWSQTVNAFFTPYCQSSRDRFTIQVKYWDNTIIKQTDMSVRILYSIT